MPEKLEQFSLQDLVELRSEAENSLRVLNLSIGGVPRADVPALKLIQIDELNRKIESYSAEIAARNQAPSRLQRGFPPSDEPSELEESGVEPTDVLSFDVFLSHNSTDKPAVRDLKQLLLGARITSWLDEDELQPGIPWQERLEMGIRSSNSVAVLIGKDGLGPWEDEEMQAALRLAVRGKRPVIPVLMPGAPSKPELPMFLGNRTWVDLRRGLTDEGLDRLQWGITGIKPGNEEVAYPVSTTLPRAESADVPECQSRQGRECKIVLFASNPQGTGQLALDKEVREIEAKIRAAGYRDPLRLISKSAVRPDDLLQALNEHRPQIVHFSGHGSDREEILLADDQGNIKPVGNRALGALFRTMKDNVRLVLLNACFSQPQAQTIIQHIDCAIGMSKAIGDNAAITFAASFYRALGFGGSINEAFEQGRTALLLEGIPEEETPLLLVRTGVDPRTIFFVRA